MAFEGVFAQQAFEGNNLFFGFNNYSIIFDG
jgi:hypothetical protein